MASISITGIQLGVDNQSTTLYLANEAIAAGECVYLDADGEANVADNTSATTDEVVGIALQAADALNYCQVVTSGKLQISNAALAVGDTFYLSDNGDIQQFADLVSTDLVSIIGVMTTTTVLTININNTGAVRA